MHQEIFPFGFYGDYLTDEYNKTNNLGIMCREEGLKACHLFSKITNKFEREIPYEQIINKEFDFKEHLKNNDVFAIFFQEIAYSLIKILSKINNHEYYRLFSSPDIFDGLVI
jgi:hypothetical protein